MSQLPPRPDLGGFPQFERLPPEIRDMIWRLQITPRIVYVQVDGIYFLRNLSQIYLPGGPLESFDVCRPRRTNQLDSLLQLCRGDWSKIPDLFLSSPTALPLLHVSRESRALVEKVYSKLYFRGTPSSYIKSVWFNFEQDTLYTDFDFEIFHPSRNDFIGDDAKKIQRLAILSRFLIAQIIAEILLL
jgi:hypothetical protein